MTSGSGCLGPATVASPSQGSILPLRERIRALNLFERFAFIDLLSDEALLVLAAAEPPDVPFVVRLLEGVYTKRLAALQERLTPAPPAIDAQRLAAAAQACLEAFATLGTLGMTPEQAQAMDQVAERILAMPCDSIRDAGDWLPWAFSAALVTRNGGQQGPLGRHLQACSPEWDAIEFWLPLTQDGRYLKQDADQWLAKAATVLPGFAWTQLCPPPQDETDSPAYEGWLALDVRHFPETNPTPRSGSRSFHDLASLGRRELMLLLRDLSSRTVALALPPAPQDAVRQAILAVLSPELRRQVETHAQAAQPTWALRSRAQAEMAARADELEAAGALRFPCPTHPAVEPAPHGAAQVAALLEETDRLRRLVLDLPPSELRALLSGLSTADVEAVASAPPLDNAFLEHVCAGLAARAADMLRDAVSNPGGQTLPAGALQEAHASFHQQLEALASVHATDAQQERFTTAALQLLSRLEARADGLNELCSQLDMELNLELLRRTGGPDGPWGRQLRNAVSKRSWAMLMEDLGLSGAQPLRQADAERWLRQLEPALATLGQADAATGPGKRGGGVLSRLARVLGWFTPRR